jgi:predicted nucleic acid-binding protein
MKFQTALEHASRLFLDTAPVIYFIEKHPSFTSLTTAIFDGIDSGRWQAVTSPITLAETLVIPCRDNLVQLQRDFVDLIVSGANTICVSIDPSVGAEAAALRAKYNLTLTDAIQIAVAMNASCDVFLTNDGHLGRVTEIPVLILSNLEM